MPNADHIVQTKTAEVRSTQEQQLEVLLARAIEAEDFDECDKLTEQMHTIQWKHASSIARLQDSHHRDPVKNT